MDELEILKQDLRSYQSRLNGRDISEIGVIELRSLKSDLEALHNLNIDLQERSRRGNIDTADFFVLLQEGNDLYNEIGNLLRSVTETLSTKSALAKSKIQERRNINTYISSNNETLENLRRNIVQLRNQMNVTNDEQSRTVLSQIITQREREVSLVEDLNQQYTEQINNINNDIDVIRFGGHLDELNHIDVDDVNLPHDLSDSENNETVVVDETMSSQNEDIQTLRDNYNEILSRLENRQISEIGSVELSHINRDLIALHRLNLELQEISRSSDMNTADLLLLLRETDQLYNDIQETMIPVSEMLSRKYSIAKQKLRERRNLIILRDSNIRMLEEFRDNFDSLRRRISNISDANQKQRYNSILQSREIELRALEDLINSQNAEIDRLTDEIDTIAFGGRVQELENTNNEDLKNGRFRSETPQDRVLEEGTNNEDLENEEQAQDIPVPNLAENNGNSENGENDNAAENEEEQTQDVPVPNLSENNGNSENGENDNAGENEEEQSQDIPVPNLAENNGNSENGENGNAGEDEEEQSQDIPVPNLSGNTNPSQENDRNRPFVVGNNPRLTWKTALAVAAGVGMGATVFFTTGPLGVSVMTVAGSVTNMVVSKKRKDAAVNRLGGSVEVDVVEEPSKGLRTALNKFKKYLKSEEGLRDISWLINSAIITGNVLSIGSALKSKFAAVKKVDPTVKTDLATDTNLSPDNLKTKADLTAKVDATPNTNLTAKASAVPSNPAPTPASVSPTGVTPPSNGLYDNIVLGNNVGNYNVTFGNRTATSAFNGFNTTHLNQSLVNGESMFNRFAIVDNNGVLQEVINTQGLSLQELLTQKGIGIENVVVDVAKNGTSQAWISVKNLLEGVEMTTPGIMH